MGLKGFSLSYIAVDPLDEDAPGGPETETDEDDQSGEIQPTYFPGYYGSGSLKAPKKGNNDDDYEEPDETNYKKPDEDLDEDLVTDNEDNFIYNSNRINKENSKIAESNKKKDTVDGEEEEEDDD